MTDTRTPRHTPDRHAPPGEVERDNDAHRSNQPRDRQRESTAQETARQVTPPSGTDGHG